MRTFYLILCFSTFMVFTSCKDETSPEPIPSIVAEFATTVTTIEVKDAIQFQDLSTGNPTSWTWTVTGGIPSKTLTYTNQHPAVYFDRIGEYTVTLEASNETKVSKETKTNFITVTPFLNNGLTAYYTFDGNANDFVNTNHGTVTGASLVSDRHGISNAAYSLDGIDDYISFGDKSIFEPKTSDFSMSIWVYNDQHQFGPVVMKRHEQGSYNQYGIYFSAHPLSGGASKKVNIITRASGSSQRYATSTSLTNGWHLLSLTHDYDGYTKLYIDSTCVDSANHTLHIPLSVAGEALEIGRNQNTGLPHYFQGKVDDFRYYNRALTADEIMELYTY